MTLFEIVDNACRHGCYPVVKNGKFFNIISPHKDSGGNWRESQEKTSIKASAKSISSFMGRGKDGWSSLEAKGWKFHSYYTPPFEYYKPGVLVDVLENAREIPGFDTPAVQKMIGQKGLEIRSGSRRGYEVYTEDKRAWFYLPHDDLVPHIPEQPTEAVVELENGKTYKVQILEEVK